MSVSSFAEGVFNMKIPQPDYVSNDWDGDGVINSIDNDDDDDGELDINDSTPFGGIPGGSITQPYVYSGDTCEDNGSLLQITVDELNLWSGFSNTTSSWCSLTGLNVNGLATSSIVPESIGGLINLTYLNLQDNKITNIPKSVINLINLEYLYLHVNELTEITIDFSLLPNLTRLFLYSNPGSPFPDVNCSMVSDCRK